MESIFLYQENIIKAIFPNDTEKKETQKGPHQLKFEKLNFNSYKNSQNENLKTKLNDSFIKSNKNKRKTLKEIAKSNQKLTDKFPSRKQEIKESGLEKQNDEKQLKEEKFLKQPKIKFATEKDITKDNQISELKIKKEKTIKNKEKSCKKEKIKLQPEEPENYFSYANLFELNRKNSLTLSETILLILEISINSKNYGLSLSNTTRKFWNEVFQKEEFKNLLKTFQPETIRKYWRIIREIPDHQKIYRLIESNADSLNNNQYKLLTVLRLITSYGKKITNNSDEKKLKDYLQNNSTNLSQTVREGVSDSDDDKEIERHVMLERKRNRDNFINNNNNMNDLDINSTANINIDLKVKKDGGNYNFTNNPPKIKTNFKFEKKSDINFPFEEYLIDYKVSQEEVQLMDEVEEILIELKNVFKEVSRDRIFDILRSVSFNLEKAYLILSNSEYFQDLAFDEKDDYIIKNMKKLSYFPRLLGIKGRESVEEREEFLSKIDKK